MELFRLSTKRELNVAMAYVFVVQLSNRLPGVTLRAQSNVRYACGSTSMIVDDFYITGFNLDEKKRRKREREGERERKRKRLA